MPDRRAADLDRQRQVALEALGRQHRRQIVQRIGGQAGAAFGQIPQVRVDWVEHGRQAVLRQKVPAVRCHQHGVALLLIGLDIRAGIGLQQPRAYAHQPLQRRLQRLLHPAARAKASAARPAPARAAP